MPLWVGLLVALLIIGVLFWAAQRILAVIPIAEPFRTVIYVVLVIVALFALLDLFGLLPSGMGLGLGVHSRELR